VYRDSPLAPSVTNYLNVNRLCDIRTWLHNVKTPDNSVISTLHLKIQSRTSPYVLFDGCAAPAERLLAKADESWRDWPICMWYTAALMDGLMQPGGEGPDTVMSVDDGLSSSIPQLVTFLATTPPFEYGLKMNKAKIRSRTNSKYAKRMKSHEHIEFHVLTDSYMYCFKSKLLLCELENFMGGKPVDWAYEPVLQYLQELQDGKDATISTHRTTRLNSDKHTWNAGPDVEEDDEGMEEEESEDDRDTDEGQRVTDGMFKQHARAIYAAFCGA
jgi:hypothetical protein